MSNFIVFGMPRSRTFWLSRFLEYGPYICAHDQIRYMRSLEDAKSWLHMPYTGSVETGAAPWWRLINHINPNIKTAVITRDPEEVLNSIRDQRNKEGLQKINDDLLIRHLNKLQQKLLQVSKRNGCYRCDASDLDKEYHIKHIFEHCLGLQFDKTWWESLKNIDLQQPLYTFERYLQSHQRQLDIFKNEAKQKSLYLINHRKINISSVEFKEENIDIFMKENKSLLEQHASAVKEPGYKHEEINLPLFKKLYNSGNLQILTARSNGKLFGYMVSIIGPSLEDKSVVESTTGPMFASPLIPGLGAKMIKMSNDILKAKGVKYVNMRAGVRGDGPRLNGLYSKMGAQSLGAMYRLNLE